MLQGIPPLCVCLIEEHEDHIKAAAAWALGQIGRHTAEHARHVAVANVLPTLLDIYVDTRSSEDLKMKASIFVIFAVWYINCNQEV